MTDEVWVRRLDRERRARVESELIAEQALRDLYEAGGLVSVLQQVAVAANEAATFEAAVAAALRAVCAHTHWPVGHLYRATPKGLESSDVWHLDDTVGCEPFRVATATTEIGPGVGLPGRVLATEAPAWIPDVTTDPNFPRAQAAAEVGLRAGFAFPVVVGSEVVGILEFFAHQAVEPNEPLLATLANVGSQLGRVVERLRAEEALRWSEQRTREIIETANDAFVAVDDRGKIIDWNREAERCFGWSRVDVLGRHWTELLAGTRPDLGDAYAGRRVELVARHRDGHQFPVELTSWSVEATGGSQRNAFIHDITERKAFQRELEHQSLHDALTQLPNRALLLDRLQHALDRGARRGVTVAVFFVDLDRFKAVNDSFGHQVGDELLVQVAARLSSVLRPEDTVARLSGDEFVALCEDVVDEVLAVELGERILTALSVPFAVGGNAAHVSASIGIAFSSPEATPETLLGNADIAMYRAKERGKGVCEVFDDSLRIEVTERLATERTLRRSIDEGGLVAHFQPVVDVRSGAVIGAEALVRWQHPERGLLFPGDFIPLAEDSSLVGKLGAWMVRASCARLRAWRDERPDLPLWVAVNLSVKELEQRHLLETVAASLAEHDLPPAALVFEVTETAVMHDARAVLGHLAELRTMGVGLAIDDFGTGWSSLDRLRRMPVQTLKIDRSFISEMDTTPGGTALVAAIVAMSHSLGLEVVAEGVELPEQLRRLRNLGCDQAQGYLLGRPAPRTSVAELLDVHQVPDDDSNLDVHDELAQLVAAAVLHARSPEGDVERTARSLVAELHRLLDREPAI